MFLPLSTYKSETASQDSISGGSSFPLYQKTKNLLVRLSLLTKISIYAIMRLRTEHFTIFKCLNFSFLIFTVKTAKKRGMWFNTLGAQ